eukprot:tig00000523_g1838.t1
MTSAAQYIRAEEQPLLSHVCHEETCHSSNSHRGGSVLFLSMLLLFAAAAVEIAGTALSGSLLLIADVAHLASDLSALSISFAASYFSAKPPSARWSYGFHRAEIIFAVLGVLVIWGYSGFLVWTAVHRLMSSDPRDLGDTKWMAIAASASLAIVALVGVLLHGQSLFSVHHIFGGIFKSGREGGVGHVHYARGGPSPLDSAASPRHSHGSSGSYCVHPRPIGLLQSLVVVLVALAIHFRPAWPFLSPLASHWHQVDPAAALAVLLLVLPATVSLLTGNVAVLMEATPPGVSPDTVKGDLLQIASVTEVHDLHVWSVAVNLRALSVHLVAEAEPGQQGRVQREVLEQAQEILLARHAIDHTTIQARPAPLRSAPPLPAPPRPAPPRPRPAPGPPRR